MTLEYITRHVATLKQSYTQSNGRRPFGISCLIGGFDYDGTPHLYQTDPSGTYHEWKVRRRSAPRRAPPQDRFEIQGDAIWRSV